MLITAVGGSSLWSKCPRYPERRVGRQTDQALVGNACKGHRIDTSKHLSSFRWAGEAKRGISGQGARVYG